MNKVYHGGRLCLLLAFEIALYGQSPSNPKSDLAQMVSIPVTVTNKNGEPITGLNASQFSLLENGRKQPLKSVVETAPLLAGKKRTKVAFVVLDALGIALLTQSAIRKECLQFLEESVLSEEPVSLSEIDRDGLRVVHEVTTPKSALVSALLALDGENPFLKHRDQLKAVDLSAVDKSLLSAETDRLRLFRRGSVEAANMMGTFSAQLRAFQQIANALQKAKGRKTVIWLTSYYPIEVNEAQNSINIDSYGTTSPFPVKSASVDYQRTINVLNATAISVFPVQIANGETSPATAVIFDNPETLHRKTISGLRHFARSTGGEAMIASDTIARLVKRAEDLTTTYYLANFQPESMTSDIKWKTLKLEVNPESATVKSPDGLFVFAVK